MLTNVRFTAAIRKPLNKYMASLRDLKHAGARRSLQLMALVLDKSCTAADACFRPRPLGLTGEPMPCVIIFLRATSMHAK